MYRDPMLKPDENAIFTLRSLYRTYGYTPYKMNKFEEYDLYVRNKDFLISDHIITFTDTNGKLMALKPDVTLSIIKNAKDSADSIQKVYYNENVYRVSKGTHAFKEIMQTGLECIGQIDDYCIYEVVMLAAKSLMRISEDWVLDISHLGIVSAVVNALHLSADAHKEILKCIGEKNTHGIASVCQKEQVSEEKTECLKQLVNLYGAPKDILPKLQQLLGDTESAALQQLTMLTKLLNDTVPSDKIRIDFSVMNDMNYYNGIVFRGFISGIPTGILSGGQYDHLMKRLDRKAGAIGFAIYLDMLERFGETASEYDIDTVLLYGTNTDTETVCNTVRGLTEEGKSVTVQKTVPAGLRYRQLLRINGKEVETVE